MLLFFKPNTSFVLQANVFGIVPVDEYSRPAAYTKTERSEPTKLSGTAA